jgi:A/G-specific adenine glycosylase
MDLGATICTPRSPACGICPWAGACQARAAGIAADLPRKSAKPVKPVRQGVLWLGHSNDSVLVERRPQRGLLGGMLGFPGDGWDGTRGNAPAVADWRDIGEVRHTFTHFHLILRVLVGRINGNPMHGELVPAAMFRPSDLPTVMRKAWDLGRNVILDGPTGFANVDPKKGPQ